MNRTIYSPYSVEAVGIFDYLERRGKVEIDDIGRPGDKGRIITAATSVAMLQEVAGTLDEHNISVESTPRDADDECAVECPICCDDMENARALNCGHVFCEKCIRSNTCPICAE